MFLAFFFSPRSGNERGRFGLKTTIGPLTPEFAENSKYQFMEQNLQRRVAGLKDKLPDIHKTLDTVQFLKARRVCAAPADHFSTTC